VLCHAAGQRLAVVASEVDAFEPATSTARYAGSAFDDAPLVAPAEAKALRHGAWTLAVDRVEVFSLPVPRLAVPAAMRGTWGGALLCFVECTGELWPVVSLARLARGGAAP
jgi:hypothetical protein